MNWPILILLLLILVIASVWLIRSARSSGPESIPMPAEWKHLLEEHVKWYNKLPDDEQRKLFREDVMRFLQAVRITPIETEISDLDKLYIAASAVIPTFHFRSWTIYPNLDEVIVYPDRFAAENYRTEGEGRNVLGMVGWNVMHGKMILSLEALRFAFTREEGHHHVGIHEFAHLLDKMDGATDGVPEYLLGKEYTVPWLSLMHKEMEKIREGHSDIRPYGATNEAEFFAVIAEYFFTDPRELERDHPEMYMYLKDIFDDG